MSKDISFLNINFLIIEEESILIISIIVLIIIIFLISFSCYLKGKLLKLNDRVVSGVVIDRETLNVVMATTAFMDIMHKSRKEVIKQDFLSFIYEKDVDIFIRAINNFSEDVEIRLFNGNLFWALLKLKHEKNRIIVTIVDIADNIEHTQEIKNLILTLPGGIVKILTDSHEIKFISKGSMLLFGYTEEDIENKSICFDDLIFPEDRNLFISTLKDRPNNISLTIRVICSDGGIKWITCNGNRVRDSLSIDMFQFIIMDVTKQVIISKKLKKERETLLTYFEMTEETIVEYLIAEDRLVSSDKSCEAFGFPKVIDGFYNNIKELNVIYPKDLPAFFNTYSGLKDIKQAYQVDVRIKNKTQKYEWYNIKSITLYEDGIPYKIITKLVNTDSQKKKIEALVEMTQRDSLTGLYNSGNISRIINEYLAANGQTGNHSLLMIDIDNFKDINDNYGHYIGDDIIVQFASRLLGSLGKDNFLGRIGGDEFVALIKNCNQKIVIDLIKKFLKSLQEPFISDGQSLLITCSVGISMYPKDDDIYEGLFKKADIACYASKDKGKNSYTFFDKDMSKDNGEVKALNVRSSKADTLITDVIDILGKKQLIVDGVKESLNKFSNYFGFNYAYLFSYQEEDNIFDSIYTFDYDKNTLEKEENANPISSLLISSLRSGNLLYVNDINVLKSELPELYQTMTKRQTKTVLVCGVFENDELKNLITFGSYEQLSYPNRQEIVAIMTMVRLIFAHLYRIKESQNMSASSQMFQAILKNQELKAYAVDTKAFKLLYVSPRVVKNRPQALEGKICYKELLGRNSQCDECPLRFIGDSDRYSSHVYNEYTKRWLGLTAIKLQWENNPNVALLYSFDITSYIEKVSFKDPLTGLSNISKFMLDGNNILHTTSSNYYLIAVDIVDFSYINETMGYTLGDKLLIELSKEFNNEARENELSCRSYNNQFLLLLHCGSKTAILRRIVSLQKKCDRLINQILGYYTSNFAAGVYIMNYTDKEMVEAINKAELALRSSINSKNKVIFYSDSLLSDYAKTKEIENRMEYALVNDEFKLYLQPKYDAFTEKIVGLEALTRWHIDDAIIYPDSFIPLFESNGFIEKMSYHMFEKVCLFLHKRLLNKEKVYPIAVNISYYYLISANFIAGITGLMEKYNIPLHLIEIELRETMFKENITLITNVVNKCYALGFRIAIDDFGTGYSSLISLKEFPVQVLKLDKGFLKDGTVSNKDSVIIKNVLNMGKELGIDVVSEGVETKEQLEVLKSLGCKYVQGYYFTKAIIAEEIEKLL